MRGNTFRKESFVCSLMQMGSFTSFYAVKAAPVRCDAAKSGNFR